MKGLVPVSYTHLDVYKRQAYTLHWQLVKVAVYGYILDNCQLRAFLQAIHQEKIAVGWIFTTFSKGAMIMLTFMIAFYVGRWFVYNLPYILFIGFLFWLFQLVFG